MATRDTQCTVCLGFGHFGSACPNRSKVGVPKVAQSKQARKNGLNGLPADFAAPHELVAAARRRADVPPYFRCTGCGLLALDTYWAPCCNSVMCGTCLGPPDATWVCTGCRAVFSDVTHMPVVVQALRDAVTAFMMAAVTHADPWSRK